MTREEVVNTVQEEVRQILNKFIGQKSNENVKNTLLSGIQSYLIDIARKMNYTHIPAVKTEVEGPFVTVNFYSADGTRLETFGDLVLYMETGLLH